MELKGNVAEVKAGQEVTLSKAFLRHTKLERESLKDFMEHMKRLTPADKLWFADQFKLEFGYKFVDAQGNPINQQNPLE